ncbi:hypothetical protein [Demequina sp. SO4-18]|uniref:hypothetical protein n=1 Tax=Demequina sp. SO4-18 TaxID=3401026 RepID=UPI003B5B94A1
MAIRIGESGTDVTYNPWHQDLIDLGDTEEPKPDIEELVNLGIAKLCGVVEAAPEAIATDIVAGGIVREAVNGAVLTAASPEFRDANSMWLVQMHTHDRSDPWPSEEFKAANDVLAGDLYDEWVDLYELQVELERKLFTLDGVHAAQKSATARCGLTIDDAGLASEPLDPDGIRLVRTPRTPDAD